MPRPQKIVPIRPVVVDGDDVVVEDYTSTSTTSQQQPPLRTSERWLADWLGRHFKVIGAAAFVRKWGAREIVDALHDGIMVWDERSGRWFVSGQIRKPGAFLHYTLKGRRER